MSKKSKKQQKKPQLLEKKKKEKKSIIIQSIIVGVFFLSFSGVFGYLGISQMSNINESDDWPFVYGDVIERHIEQHTDMKHRTTTRYRANVKYKYAIDGKFYENDMVYFDLVWSDYNEAKEIIDDYPKDAVIKVYYDPSNPKKSVLKQGSGGGYIFMLVGAIIFFIIPVGTIALAISNFRKEFR